MEVQTKWPPVWTPAVMAKTTRMQLPNGCSVVVSSLLLLIHRIPCCFVVFFTELNVLILLWKHYWEIGWTGSGVVALENGFHSFLCQLNEKHWADIGVKNSLSGEPRANEEKMKNCANRVPSALWWALKKVLAGCFIFVKVDACCFRSWAELRSKTHTNSNTHRLLWPG